jgi:hypothetical protein
MTTQTWNTTGEAAVKKKKAGWFWRLWVAAVLVGAGTAVAAQEEFPYEQEFLLDVNRLPDSKRVPILNVSADGYASIDLWCKSGPGQVIVSGSEIKITLGLMQEQRCTPERLMRDEVLAVALLEITHWRMEKDKFVLIGPTTTLRFRPSTH